jgi:hypothetical protein
MQRSSTVPDVKCTIASRYESYEISSSHGDVKVDVFGYVAPYGVVDTDRRFRVCAMLEIGTAVNSAILSLDEHLSQRST